MEPDPNAVADVLDSAAATIAERGLARRELVDLETGSVCAIGAINVAAGQPHLNMRGVSYSLYDLVYRPERVNPNDLNSFARAVLAKEIAGDGLPDLGRDRTIFVFNDRPLRRKKTVIKKMRDAAAKLRHRPHPDSITPTTTKADLELAAGDPS